MDIFSQVMDDEPPRAYLTRGGSLPSASLDVWDAWGPSPWDRSGRLRCRQTVAGSCANVMKQRSGWPSKTTHPQVYITHMHVKQTHRIPYAYWPLLVAPVPAAPRDLALAQLIAPTTSQLNKSEPINSAWLKSILIEIIYSNIKLLLTEIIENINIYY